MGLINKVDMVCLSPVGYATYAIYPTGDKHTISTLLIKPIYTHVKMLHELYIVVII